MIFLSLIFDVFKTLLVLKPNLKEVTEAISPFDFVFRFSTMENLVKSKVLKISPSEMKNIMTFQTSAGNYVLYEKGIGNLKQKLGIPQNSTIVSVIPMQSMGYLEHITYDETDDSVFVGFLIYSAIQDRVASVLVKYI